MILLLRSDRFEHEVPVQVEDGVAPESDPRALRDLLEPIVDQLAYVVQKPERVSSRKDGTYLLPVGSRSGLSSPCFSWLNSSSIGDAS